MRTPIVHFYAASPKNEYNINGSNIVARFKESLSKTISFYYPLAGRLTADETLIDCNDEGVPFIIARAKTSLIGFLTTVDHDRINLLPHFIPSDAVEHPTFRAKGLVPLAIQISVFDCGGVAIGAHVLHKVIDGTCRTQFFKTWAALFSGRQSDVAYPNFSVAISLFPMPPSEVVPPTKVPLVLRPVLDHTAHAVVVKAFAFTASNIAALRSKAKSECVPNPTRIESVTGFIWKHLMSASATVESSRLNMPESESNTHGYYRTRASAIIHSVNMRQHLHPPLPPTAFGKFTTHAFAYFDGKNGDVAEVDHLVVLLRNSLTKTKTMEFLRIFQGVGALDATREHKKELVNLKDDPSTNAYFFTSWSAVGVDFGLGSPLWTGFTGGRPSAWFRNFVPLIHTPDNGIEAWMILDEQEIAILESDPVFLRYASSCTGLLCAPKSLL